MTKEKCGKVAPMSVLGPRIQEVRKAVGMSQHELASALGLHDVTISHIECGRREPRVSMFARICEVLGVSMDDLFYGTGAATDAPTEQQMREWDEVLG